jgi:5-methylcytosine-specific restriction enzyme A
MTNKTPRDRSERAKRRRARFLRANPLCSECLKVGKAVAAVELDHRTPLHRGGADNESNFNALCHACHVDKTLRERGIEPRPTIGVDGWPTERGDK